jgi:hypothetical protein
MQSDTFVYEIELWVCKLQTLGIKPIRMLDSWSSCGWNPSMQFQPLWILVISGLCRFRQSHVYLWTHSPRTCRLHYSQKGGQGHCMAVTNEKLTRILPTADHPDGPPQVSTVDKPLQVVYQSIILQFSALRFLVCIVAVCIVDVCSALDGYFQQLSNCMW